MTYLPTMSNSLHVREFEDLTLRVEERVDGLTVEALLIPYRREIEAVDLTPQGVVRYREIFAEGSNARAVKAPNRVALTFLHDEQLQARLGFGQEFMEDREGLRGRFRLYSSQAPLARDLLTTSHRSISVGFVSIVPKAGTEHAGQVVTRESVILRHAAAVEQGQYAEARTLAVRQHQEEQEEQEAEQDAAREEAEQDAAATKQREELLAWVDQAKSEQAALRERFGLEG